MRLETVVYDGEKLDGNARGCRSLILLAYVDVRSCPSEWKLPWPFAFLFSVSHSFIFPLTPDSNPLTAASIYDARPRSS